MPWGQGKHRSRSGSVRETFSWLTPLVGQEVGRKERYSAVWQCVRAARGLQRPRRQTTFICANRKLCRSGAREDRSVGKAARAFRSSRNWTAVEKRGCHRKNMAPRRGQDSRPSLGILESACPVEGTLDRVGCFMRSNITASLSSSPLPRVCGSSSNGNSNGEATAHSGSGRRN